MRERLSIALTATLGGTEHTIPGGNLRSLSLTMTSWGVQGTVTFLQQDDQAHGGQYTDAVLADFVKPDLASVSITVSARHWDSSTDEELPSIVTSGLVLRKSVVEKVFERGFDAPPVLYRVYTLHFADPAQVLWRQHFPCDLFTDKSFKDVIEAHKGDTITLSYDWDVITTQKPLFFFHLDPARGASFYDLVHWYLCQYGGVWTFEHAAGTYAVAGQKDESGTANALLRDDIASIESIFPALCRYKPRVRNSYAASPQTEVVENEQAATSMYQDILLRTPIAQDVDDRVTLETARPRTPGRELLLGFGRFPSVAVSPGSLLEVSTTGGFSEDLIASDEPFRVYALDLEARALDEGTEADYADSATDFELSISARLEAQSEKSLRQPTITEPHFPGHLEGKVVSEQGEDADITYQIYQDETTSLDQYKVKIPLFADQIITVPFDPYQGSGTFYIPAYKDARVLVSLHFQDAHIARLLDWREGARVPMEGQGEHLYLGKSGTSNTSILHDYEDDKPVLQIKRTNEKDTAILRIEEGKLTLQVKEEEGS